MPDLGLSRLVSVSLLQPPLRRRLALAAALLLLTTATPATAQSETPTADRIVSLRLDWLSQLARQDVASWEADMISAPRGVGLTVGNFQDPSKILTELGRVMTDDYDAVRNQLRPLAEKAKAKRDEVQKDWAEVVRQRVAFRQFAEKQQAAYGFDYDSGSSPRFQPNLLDAGLAVWAIVVLGFAWQLGKKERRLETRSKQRLAAVGMLLALVTMPGCGGPPAGADTRPWAVREEAELTTADAEATEKANTAAKAAADKWAATVESWAKMASPKSNTPDPLIQDAEKELADRLTNIVIDARLTDRLARDAEEQRAKLTDEKARLDGLIAGARWQSIGITSGRVLLASLLFGFSIAPFWSARRARSRRIRVASRTCPRCFRFKTLMIERAGGESSKKYNANKKKKKKDEEAPPEEEENVDGEVVCRPPPVGCGLRFRKSYLTVPRLCFPTVGVRFSGKTHMLVTAYDRIRKRTAPTTAVMQPAPSGGDVDRRFAYLVDQILHRREEAGATDLVLPDPILLHLKDTDPAGANAAIVNLFDYSGELVNPLVDVNQLRDTAVKMDGFMLFLDPTQLTGDVTLDTQLENLDHFLSHMRAKRRIPVGRPIPVPVAVCIPKFDLLLSENPIGGQAVPYIRELLENLNPPPRHMTPEILRERSELVEQMLPLMFPGADIRGVIEGYFGNQMQFFPMSSVSLFEHELGVKDMSRRTMAPWGVAEPIMWLLHMHGYDVFSGQ